jgi:hypothetical protein
MTGAVPMTEADCHALLTELLAAYKRESAALIDPREPQRYRLWAEDLVRRVEEALA